MDTLTRCHEITFTIYCRFGRLFLYPSLPALNGLGYTPWWRICSRLSVHSQTTCITFTTQPRSFSAALIVYAPVVPLKATQANNKASKQRSSSITVIGFIPIIRPTSGSVLSPEHTHQPESLLLRLAIVQLSQRPAVPLSLFIHLAHSIEIEWDRPLMQRYLSKLSAV